MLETVATWHWDDPVSTIYREFFKQPIVVDPDFDREELLKDLQYRYEHRIPPGYKDSANEHSGVGDLIIWKTILTIGEREKRHLVFVSGEEKPDWWYRSDSRALYPRFELVDEYRRASGGKSLIIMTFAELLKRLKVPEAVVEEVKQGEKLSLVEQVRRQSEDTPFRRWKTAQAVRKVQAETAEIAVIRWLLELHPAGQVTHQAGQFPELLVEDGGEVRGFEVKYLYNPTSLFLRLQEFLGRLESGSTEGLRPNSVDLVLVLAAGRDLGPVLSRLRNAPGARSFTGTYLIGAVGPDGKFSLLSKFSPRDLDGELGGAILSE